MSLSPHFPPTPTTKIRKFQHKHTPVTPPYAQLLQKQKAQLSESLSEFEGKNEETEKLSKQIENFKSQLEISNAELTQLRQEHSEAIGTTEELQVQVANLTKANEELKTQYSESQSLLEVCVKN